MTTTLEAPVEAQAPEVAELSDDTRKELIALREGGMTLAELKTRFPQLTSERIREVLPAGNAREPKPEPASRYVEDQNLVINLSERTLACRQVMGHGALAEALDTTGSAVWRFENGRIHPDEVKGLQDGLIAVEKRIASGEFVKPERQPAGGGPSKADLTHRVEVAVELVKTARGDKAVGKAALVESLLAALDPS